MAILAAYMVRCDPWGSENVTFPIKSYREGDPFITCTTNQYMYMYMPHYSSSETKLITFYGFSAGLFGEQNVTFLVVDIFKTFHRCYMCIWGKNSTMSYNFFPISLKHMDFRHHLSSFHRETKEFYKIIFFIRDEFVQ